MQPSVFRRFAAANAPRGAVLVALLLVLCATGCVRRRLNVRSNPPGALVHVDNQRIGTTPCSVDYVYYGTREIRLSLPGYETLTVNQPLPAPWYELPGVDFISENLVPARIEDTRTVSFNLQRRRLEPPEQVIARGEELRRQVTPIGAAPVLRRSSAGRDFRSGKSQASSQGRLFQSCSRLDRCGRESPA